MSKPVALVVDDEADIRKLMTLALARMGVDCELASHVDDAKNIISHRNIDFCLTDLHLPDGHGLEIVQYINENRPDIPVAVITAYGSTDLAIKALKLGAFDFVSKPIQLDNLSQLVKQALSTREHTLVEVNDKPKVQQTGLVGASKYTQSVQMLIDKASRSLAPVYLHGAVGSGKEYIARLIHNHSARSNKPFVVINCNHLTDTNAEGILFGTPQAAGLIDQAQGGSLYFEDIQALPLTTQDKLLRLIQDKHYINCSTHQKTTFDARLFCSTTKDVLIDVQKGLFRQDLFYRLHVIEFNLLPLADRKEDILPLAHLFIDRLCQEWRIKRRALTPQAEQALISYPYPANIRELHSVIERALTLSDDTGIQAQDIVFDHINLSTTQSNNMPLAAVNLSFKAPNKTEILPEEGLENYLEGIEKDLILKALEQSKWNRTVAAKKLGMSFRSLRYRLKKLGLGQDDDSE